jgi:pepF/M3 family oligoendopeptidase
MTVVYPGLDSPEFARDFGDALAAIDATVALFDQLQIDKRAAVAVDEATIAAFEQALAALNQLFERTSTLESYIYSFVATDSRDAQAQARMSEFQRGGVRQRQLLTRFRAWIGSLDADALIAASPLAQQYAYMLRRAQRQASHQMAPAEEALAEDLSLSGGSAWSRLYNNVASQLLVAIELDGALRELPMSEVRNLAYAPERETRRRAYVAELAAWERAAVPLAAALNSVKGEVITLARRRGWADPLDLALFNNSIDRATLDAMLTAARESFPDFRRYLRAKARMLGVKQLPWYDLFAPVRASARAWSYDEAAEFIAEQFGGYSERMRDFAARAFRERWIDAAPRAGKRDGAFCMPLRADESRILANYQPSFKSVLTLAHELGHGYHNTNLARHAALNRGTPMTLAETASIFCETIVRNAVMRSAGPDEQIEILESTLVNAGQVVVDISSRFLFEQRLFEQRQARELAVDELCAIMRDAQADTYGDGLDQAALHPYMWAAKSHYYTTGNSFYNFPYMFGMLFGLGLYARYQRDPAGFKIGYDDLLGSTGLADAGTLAERMEIDIRSPDFWRASLATIRADIDRFEELARSA